VHGPAQRSREFLAEAHSPLVTPGDETWVRGTNELERSSRDFDVWTGALEGALALTEDMSVDRYLRERVAKIAPIKAIDEIRAVVEGFDAADPATASARAIADEWNSGVNDTSARPSESYHAMFEHLREQCERSGATLLLSTVVPRVTWKTGEVCVAATDADGKHVEVRARAAIVTLPLAVLQYRGEDAVVFDPELDAKKRAAIDVLKMGHVVKVVLAFRMPFWETLRHGRYQDAAFFRDAKGVFAAYWTQRPVRSTAVVAWAGGPKAVAMSAFSSEERIEHATRGFGALFGEGDLALRECVDAACHDWTQDPFARGAYSFVGVGGSGARSELGAPCDRTLFFAGEACSLDGQGGTVNGAIETGERAATEAATVLGAKSIGES
jgi:monoamine oxidase